MTAPLYIRLKQSIGVEPQSEIRLKDVGRVTGPVHLKRMMEELVLHHVSKEDQNIVVIDGFTIVEQIVVLFPNQEIELIGPAHCVVHINKMKAKPSLVIVALIWLLLFVGAAMAIMNFHYDVSMEPVQQKLHYMLTGQEEEHPLWIQIPYSIGLGVGMILFFNHWFKKRFNEEPSPMEVEVFNYQENLDHYAAVNENKVENQHEDR
ncbi:stage V sporulation protein AA [Halobacillus salinarum]|uniref:Stage V sporulation protein AA n=1 Tax=Halobacillus salinarum TaxID=2932257 RepID=A0ABY4EDX1_9BACI|nr:stage V sporulation protein AA [Halobacillus salinarum]UOQ42651.1 stage V sporulation protein AA [Halobacillus salinarum]